MPITTSAKKAVRVAKRRKIFNDRRRKTLRLVLKKTETLVKQGSFTEAVQMLPKAYKAIDKAAKRGVLKKNTASRRKAKLARLVRSTSSTKG